MARGLDDNHDNHDDDPVHGYLDSKEVEMTADGWRRSIGAELFDHLVEVLDATIFVEDALADVLSHATEMGFKAPTQAPRVSPNGTKTLWPAAVLTTEGLLRYYAERGHKWYLLRVPQMLRAHRGPAAARLQESLALYDSQCEVEGVDPLPAYADMLMFVGGEGPVGLGGLAALSRETHERGS